QGHALAAVHGDDHLVALALQPPRQHVAVHLVIFDQKDLWHRSSLLDRPSCRSARRSGFPAWRRGRVSGRKPRATNTTPAAPARGTVGPDHHTTSCGPSPPRRGGGSPLPGREGVKTWVGDGAGVSSGPGASPPPGVTLAGSRRVKTEPLPGSL